MRVPLTLSLYIARHFLLNLAIVFGTIAALIIVIDALELIRKSSSRDVPIYIVFQMAFLKFPQVGQKIIPFAMLIGAVLSYTKLTRNNELVVLRGAGVSVWQFLMPSLLTSFTIGVLMIFAINPLSALMIFKYETMESKHLYGKSNFLEISKSGIWLRQKNTSYDNAQVRGETIIHANNFGDSNIENITLHNVIIFVYGAEDTFIRRIDAKQADLLDDFWHLHNTIITAPNGKTSRHDEYFLETELTVLDIHNSFASPDTISFYELPKFIETMKKSGFSALSHRLYWHSIVISPFFYSAMVLIAALFSLRHTRQGGSGKLITASILSGFLIYFLSNLISSLGLSGSMPIPLAAWVPVVVSMLVGVGLLLHLEDG
jgi:lipopolysaccharide export system permease protein